MPSRTEIALSRRNRRMDERRSRLSRLRKTGLGLGVLLSILLTVTILAGALAYADLTRDLPSPALLPVLLNPPDGLLLHPTRIYDRSGQHLLVAFVPPGAPSDGSATRRYIPLADSSPQHLPSALAATSVALLDPGFWSHGGYRLSGLGDPASHPTIAQKLVSDLLLYNEPPSFRRALRERLLAAQITSEYGRGQVLEWYLNSADYGNDAYGADAAAQLYFGVSATELTPAQAAVLAAASDSPGLNPLDAASLARERGRTAVQLARGFGLLSTSQASAALAENLSFAAPPPAQPRPPTLVSLALRQLDSLYTADRIRRGGLVVLTTLDYDLQQSVTCTTLPLAGAAPEACPGSRPAPASTAPAASALVLDPRSGQVLAAAGEVVRGQPTSIFSPRDPGTLMASFVYLTAFTRGFSPGSLVWDIPPSQAEDGGALGAGLPASAFHGPVRMRVALANDYSGANQRVAAQMGAEAVRRTEASFGLDPSNASLLDLASAYAVFAANGVRYGLPGPSAVLRVEGLDHRLWLDLSSPQAQPVVTPALAYLVNSSLSDEAARWPTLGHPSELEIGRPLGVKLGASADGSDSWGIAYTPSRLVAVWLGASQPEAGAAPVSPNRQQAVSLLASLTQAATASVPADGWSAPAGVTTLQVCDPSGLLPTRDCPSVVNEVFLSGNEPHQPDTLFRTFTVNRETGFLATVFTPPELVEDRVFMLVPPEAQAWAKAANVPSAPTAYDAIQPPPVDPYVHVSVPAMFAEVTGQVQFRGTASGADFASYRLLVGQGLNPQSWTVVADSTTRVEDGVLGTWDTSGLSGLYAVELQVLRTDQRLDTAITQITVK